MNCISKTLFLSSAFFFTACNCVQEKAPQSPALDTSAMDLSVRPQDDFYNFVNGNWMKTAKIPSDKASWGSFNILRETTDENSLLILEELLKNNPTDKQSEAYQIKHLYQTFIDWEARNQAGISPIEDALNQVKAIASLQDLQKFINESTQKGFNPLYGWGTYADMKNSKVNAVYLGDISLGMGRDYYQKENEINAERIGKYQEYVAKLLAVINWENPEQTAAQIVDFERSVAKLKLTNEQVRDANLSYNPQTMTELKSLVKNIDLPAYLTSVGVQTDKVIISEIGLYKKFDEFISEKNIPLLKNYLAYRIIASSTGILTQEIDQISFDFYGKYLNGQQEQRPMNKRALGLINGILGEAFGKLYVEKYFPESSKEDMKILVDFLLKSFKIHIKNLEWMSAPTKEKALEKLSKFVVKIGYPDKWEDYSQMQILSKEEGGNYFKNLENIEKWAYQKQLSEVGKEVDKDKWHMSPQTVNAYYNPLNNEIVFPAAILQPPFYNPNADAAVNFGGIGAVIGHEITHGFDDSGAMFNSEGNLENWWTDEDKQNFEKVTQALAEQFNQYEPVKGTFINGKFTNGENIADLGGVSIAYDALHMYLGDQIIEDIDNFTPSQRFFISWATVWRTLSTEEYKINQVKTDVHSPGYFRAFAPLTNVDAFYKAFDVKEGDKHYKKPEDRIKIW